MNIRVILFGTLGKSFSNHDLVDGMAVELPAGSTVGDLIAHIDLPTQKLGMVSMDGNLVKADNMLKENAVVRVFQPIFGG